MNERGNSTVHLQVPLNTIKFPMIAITIIIITGIFVCSLIILNQNHTAMAQQQTLAPKDISFEIDNVTFSHHMTPVNGIQLHYVIGGHGFLYMMASYLKLI
jgi:hypothetical protein